MSIDTSTPSKETGKWVPPTTPIIYPMVCSITGNNPMMAHSPNTRLRQANNCMCPACQYYKACGNLGIEILSPELLLENAKNSFNSSMQQLEDIPNSAPNPQRRVLLETSNMGPISLFNSKKSSFSEKAKYPTKNYKENAPGSNNPIKYAKLSDKSQYKSKPHSIQPQPVQPHPVQPYAQPHPVQPHPVQAHSQRHWAGRVVPSEALEQFRRSVGGLADAACTPEGRAMLLAVLSLNQAEKRRAVFEEVLGDIGRVCLDPIGCHVAKFVVEGADEQQLAALLEKLDEPLVLRMCTVSQHTRRIVQSLVDCHSMAKITPIVTMITNNAVFLSSTQQGCISLMRIYEKGSKKQKENIATLLLPSLHQLCHDPYGNYVVQCIVEHTDINKTYSYVAKSLAGHLFSISVNKFGSNVCEKLINTNHNGIRSIILNELIFNNNFLHDTANDGYGNFVLQTLITTCSKYLEFKKISERLRPYLTMSSFGHRIDQRIKLKRHEFYNMKHTMPYFNEPQMIDLNTSEGKMDNFQHNPIKNNKILSTINELISEDNLELTIPSINS